MCSISHSQKYASIQRFNQHTHMHSCICWAEADHAKDQNHINRAVKWPKWNEQWNEYKLNKKNQPTLSETVKSREKKKHTEKTSCTRTAFIDLVHYTTFFVAYYFLSFRIKRMFLLVCVSVCVCMRTFFFSSPLRPPFPMSSLCL